MPVRLGLLDFADLPVTDRPTEVVHRLWMKKGSHVTSKGIVERDPKADPA